MRHSAFILSFFLPLLFMVSCKQSTLQDKNLQTRLDSLQSKLDNIYKPGIGEIMNTIIQPHHLKLWLAGQHKNWALAQYENNMILKGFKRIQKFHKDKPESAMVPMIYPALSAMEKAIGQKDSKAFQKNFVLITNTCNNCHNATKNNFNVIIVPTDQNMVNQKFD